MRLNILYIVPYVPSLVRVRPYHLIRGLCRRGHRVTVATLWTDEGERRQLKRLAAETHAVLAKPLSRARPLINLVMALPTSEPLQAAYCWDPALADELRRAAFSTNRRRSFDIVHVEHLRGARYGLVLKAQPALGAPIVWDSVDCISRLFRQAASNGASRISRMIARFEIRRTERHETWLLGQFDRALVTSSHEAVALHRLNSSATEISVVPNGVDQAYFTPDETSTRNPSAIVLTGKMSYHANVTMALHFVRDVLPPVWESRADVKLWIVGQDPPREIRSLAQHPQITVTGTVPDIRPYLRSAAVAVAPAPYAAGVQNKVLEAMACGTPVVASPQAVAALDAQHGRELLVAGDSQSFAQGVIALLNDQGIRRALGRAGRRYVERSHRWEDSVSKLEDIYGELVGA